MSALEPVLGGPAIEVVAKATRRRFTVEYKRKILREAETCKAPGPIGALLRREGLYSSHLTTWRAARERGKLAGAPTKPGPVRRVADPRDKRITEQVRRVPARRPGDHQDPQPAPRLQRQPVLGGAVQDAEVPVGLPGAVRLDLGCPRPLPPLLPLVQRRTSSQRSWPAHPSRRALRLGRAAHGGPGDRARHRLCRPPGTLPARPPTAAGAPRGCVDQPPETPSGRGDSWARGNSRRCP